MHKLIRYLKPYILPLLLVIVLLYGQAMAELALPDYMSDLVNVGVQQSGVETVYPLYIPDEQFTTFTNLLSEEDANLLESHYVKIDSSNQLDEANQIRKQASKYFDGDMPDVFYAHIYPSDSDQIDNQFEIMMSKVLLAYNKLSSDSPEMLSQLAMMSQDQKSQMLDQMNAYFINMSDSMLIQSGAQAQLEFYKAVNIDTHYIQNQFILHIGLIMLIVTILGAMAAILVGYIASRVAAGTGRNLRKDIFEKVSTFTNREVDQFSTASLITRSTNDITQIQNLLVIIIRMLLFAPIMGIGGVVKAIEKSTSMSWIIALAVIILLGVIALLFSIVLPKFKIVQQLVDKINLVMRENLTGMMVIRAFNTQNFEENRFDNANRDLMENNLFVNRIMIVMMPVMTLIMNGVSLAIIWVGAHQIQDSALQVGDMIAFMQYSMQIIMSFLMLSIMFIMIPRASVSAGRIADVLATEATVKDPKAPKQLPQSMTGNVEFKHVSFKFPGAEEEMLKDLSFTAPAGQTTAIIGSTGSGKSTMVNLIPRFYDATGGDITIDGISIKEMKLHDLRDLIGYVPQKSVLFSGTIESNMTFAKEDATQDEIMKAIEVAQAKEIVDEKEKGIKDHIAQGGGNISGGQKQRFSIARALVKKPKVFIFDDSFSALDFKTDAALRKALKDYTGDSTVLLVAQRIASIRNAEQIIVLDDGKMVGIGTHDVLMKTCKTYQEIAYSQLSAEELS